MRREKHFGMSQEAAKAFLTKAPIAYLMGALADEEHSDVLKILNPVVIDGYVAFHGSKAGEKIGLIGQKVVVSAYEVLAEIPSYFVDPQMACPATTYFRSVQAVGYLESVEDLEIKAKVLTELMRKYQSEGGYLPFSDPMYTPQLKGVSVLQVSLERITGKLKLGQNLNEEKIQSITTQLFERGRLEDLRAIEEILAANPQAARPSFLRSKLGHSLHVWVDNDQLVELAELVRGTYWTPKDISSHDLLQRFKRSTLIIGVQDQEGKWVACVRALSDGIRAAHIYDMVVVPQLRGLGLGREVFELLMKHPMIRNVQHISLSTLDAMKFYDKFGFQETGHQNGLICMARTQMV